jgi:MoaA/NifB/PqqE/SkfB family radical SAM enzyme
MNTREDIAYYAKHAVNKGGLVAGQLEVTDDCFQRCRFCDSWRERQASARQGTHMPFELATSIVVQLQRDFSSFEHLSLTGGDPQAWSYLPRFLRWFSTSTDGRVTLQISTALARDIEDVGLWRTVVHDVRLSLDAITPEVYQQRRGDRENTPQKILDRVAKLAHPRFATITTVGPDNIDEVPKIVETLDALHLSGVPVRKMMFLPVLGKRAEGEDASFWGKWAEYVGTYQFKAGPPTSFGENPAAIRAELESPAGKAVRCWIGSIAFHIKPNGDYYACCLLGGEALPTNRNFQLGCVVKESLRTIWQRHVPLLHYANCDCECEKICQFKQYQLNRAAERAFATRLAMP